jgi:DNA-binding SARP family transcriptional activator
VFDVEVLGPLAVRYSGRRIRLGPKLRIMVTALLTADGFTLAAEQLRERLWGSSQGETAMVTLRSHVSHFRRAVSEAGQAVAAEREILLTEKLGGGQTAYRLVIPPERLDSRQLERLVIGGRRALHAGDYEKACARFSDALSLWRGDPFPDADGRPFAHAEITRLKDLYLIARIGRAEAEVALGRHREVVGELQALATEYPYHGEIHTLLIHSLNRSQRVIEASQAARTAVQSGLDWGLNDRALTRLQEDLLRGTLALSGPLSP